MKHISYGMPQLIELDQIEESVQLYSELGLDFIELNCNLPACQPEIMNVQYLNLLKSKYNVSYILRLPENLDLGHFNRHIREAHLRVIEEAIGVADRLGCKILNIHMNPGPELSFSDDEDCLYEKYERLYLENLMSSMELIDIWLGGTGVLIGIENTGMFNRSYIQAAVKELLKSGRFCLTWSENQKSNLLDDDYEFLLKHQSEIKYIHLPNQDDEKRQSVTFQEGIKEKLQIAQKNQASVLIKAQTNESLKQSAARIKEWHIFK